MKEDDQVVVRRLIPIANVVQFESVAEGVEEVSEARQRCLGEVPEAISLCPQKSATVKTSSSFGKQQTDRELQFILLCVSLEEGSILYEQPQEHDPVQEGEEIEGQKSQDSDQHV